MADGDAGHYVLLLVGHEMKMLQNHSQHDGEHPQRHDYQQTDDFGFHD